MPFADGWRGARLHYEERGSGRPLVLVHGWMGDLELWAPSVPRLAEAFRVVAYSRRGHGESTAPGAEWTVEADARDLTALIAHLELDDPIVVGWSMGGGVALRFAEQHGFRPPAAGLGLLSTTPRYFPDDDWPLGERALEVSRRVVAAAEAGGRETVLDAMADVMLDPDERPEARALARRVMARQPLDVVNPNGRSFTAADHRGLLPEVELPVAVLHGRRDAYFPYAVAEWTAKQLPRATLYPLDAGHAPPITDPAGLAAALQDFVASL